MLQQVARCPANRHVVQAAVLVWQVLAAAAPSLLIEAGAAVGDAVLCMGPKQGWSQSVIGCEAWSS